MTLIEIVTLIIFLFPIFSLDLGTCSLQPRARFFCYLSANFGYHLQIIVTFLIGFGCNIFFSFINDHISTFR